MERSKKRISGHAKRREVEEALEWRDLYVLQNEALAPYYGSMDKYRSYYTGKMYDELEAKYGKEIFDKNLAYQNLVKAKMKDEAKEFLKQNKDLKAFRDERPKWYDEIENIVVEFGDMLPEGIPSEVREDFKPESYSDIDIEKYLEGVQPPTFTLNEWTKKIGAPEVNMLLNYYGGLQIDQEIRDYLAMIAADYGLSFEEFAEAIGQAD